MYYLFRLYDLWRARLWPILGLTLSLVAAAGFAFSPLFAEYQYAASMRVFSASTENYAPVFESGLLRDSLIQKFDLAKHYGISPSDPDWYEETAKQLDDNFLTEVSPKKNTVHLTVFDKDRERARRMVEEAARLGKQMSGGVAGQALENLSRTRALQTAALSRNLERRLEAREAELARAEAAYSNNPDNDALLFQLERRSNQVSSLQSLQDQIDLNRDLPEAAGARLPYNKTLEYLKLDERALGEFVDYWNLRKPVVFVLGKPATSHNHARPRLWLILGAAALTGFFGFSFLFVARAIVKEQWADYVRYDRPKKEARASPENGGAES